MNPLLRQPVLLIPLVLGACVAAGMSCTSGSHHSEPTSLSTKIEVSSVEPLPKVGASEIESGGTEVCVRCGAKREVHRDAKGDRSYDAVLTDEQRWAEARIGACEAHEWKHTGCWFSRYGDGGVSVSCSVFKDEHVLWKTLAALGGEPAERFAHRFAELSPERQLELWSRVNRHHSREGFEKTIARDAAQFAGWLDLVAVWDD